MALGSSGPVEAKVSWSSLAATVLTGLVFTANHTDLIAGYDNWPTWAKAAVSILVIAGGTFGAGYAAPHTPRRDPDARPTGANQQAARLDLEQNLGGTNVHKVPGGNWTTGGYPGGDTHGRPPSGGTVT